ncbi:plasma-membrane proton-e [Rhizoclosmatium globosum]|uniref:Plasma membrane ATPase n=1 Tax=Rhizoclosmatium globosum TaxID=329046 RepID=A0A1Y2BWE3_9FUNG|nr:plasma-membrane proton-e [Rhizoclosmatium globosum]|eukprot:ORY39063.1 plasma-membrane proton-e [Rhizoclosmatium globosum]
MEEAIHVEVADDIPPELEALLHTEPLHGLTDTEVAERTAQFGLNEIPENKTNPLLKFLSYFLGPISYLLEIACILSGVFEDWIDFGILLAVLIINACIGFFEEARAESALDALKNTLALKSRCWRNGKLVEVDSNTLVPGDIIALRLGDIIPADCRLLGVGVTGEISEGTLQIDQSALTGESLPVQKGKGATAYSSAIVKQGQMLAVVTKTGINTYIGRAANLISITTEEGHFQKIINSIGNFLVIITCVSMAVVLFFVRTWAVPEDKNAALGERVKSALLEVLVLTIAAIPVGLPTIMSVTMAVGASQLAKKEVIVKRLTAIEELASVSILCSDKTGTLTLNQLSFDVPYLSNKGNTTDDFHGTGVPYTEQDLLLASFFASEPGAQDAIESAIRKAAQNRVTILKERANQDHHIPGYKVNNFIPFNPTSKYTEATVTDLATGKQFRTIKGAPQVIVRMVGGHDEATAAVNDFARRGLRALGVARTIDDAMTKFEMIGMISLLDPPRPDSAHTIDECHKLGISVKMITGDQQIIGKEVAHRLGMNRTILDASKLMDASLDEEALIDRCEKCDGFAQVIPEHKYKVVELLQKRGYLVGMTGDGVNDAPALKKANVGIAVEGCTDAARSAADIVLLAAGLSTIIDGVKTSRAIFQRMRSYALYRIASTIHFLLFFFISICAYGFSLPPRLIILIAVLNDAATLVISVDNAQISQRPDKWRLGQLITLSFVLGFLLMVISWAHFFIAHYGFGYTQHSYDNYPDEANAGVLQTIMYLQISSCPHFVIFSTRLPGYFYENMPSWIFILAVAGTQVFAMFMSIFGIRALDATAIGWGWGVGVLAISTVMFMLLDIVKVQIIRKWSFDLTVKLYPTKARKAELEARLVKRALLTRVNANIVKARKTYYMVLGVVAWKKALAHSKKGKLYAGNSDSTVAIN